ncbi:HNH endonuclease [Muricoccus vinaceus]|uniref:HNH endonuclease n=1 Tax=Muricoccus vinaceus TaxID=424704 RepID=A0ABV6IXF9_9PROT
MIEQAIIYSMSEKDQINEILKSSDFSSKTWEKDDVAPIRQTIKQHYIAKQEYRCCYCQQQILSAHGKVWDVEHVIPRSETARFMFEPQNLAVACLECNGQKGSTRVTKRAYLRLPKSSQAYEIVHPHFDNYDDHIQVEGRSTYRGLTAKGAFTIYHCDLFRFWVKEAQIRKPIRDKRFEQDVTDLRFSHTVDEAKPILASILARLEIEEMRSRAASASHNDE